MSRRVVGLLGLVVLVLVGAVGCGSDDGVSSADAAAGGADGSGTSAEVDDFVGITGVESSTDRSVTVHTDPVPVEADDGECAATVTPDVTGDDNPDATLTVSIVVDADRPQYAPDDPRDADGAPITWEGCELAPRTMTVDLATPIGSRAVTDPFGSEFFLRDGRWVGCDNVVMTCVIDPASCDNGTLHDTIANSDVPRHFGMSNEHCEVPYAVVDVDVGAGACPATGDAGDNPCAGQDIRRMYWHVEDGAWVQIGSDPGPGCGAIADVAPDFPAALCADLPAIG
jgi:hypothetical protein